MATGLTITPYAFDASKLAAYLDLRARLYRNDRHSGLWSRAQWAGYFSADYPFYQQPGNAHCHFLATADGLAVGHLSAMLNGDLRDRDRNGVGAVGFFDCIDDQTVARALVTAARDWFRQRSSVQRVWAPLQFDIWHGYRLLVRGFDTRAFFGEPRNPAYYPALFEHAGLRTCKRWYSLELMERTAVAALAEKWTTDYAHALDDGYGFLPLDVRDSALVNALHPVVESSYRNFLGFTPLAPAQFSAVFSAYAETLDPRFALIATRPDGAPAGFAIAYPDTGACATVEVAAEKRPSSVPGGARAVFFMIGITPEESARRRGLGRALFHRCLTQLLAAGYASVLVALIAEDSPAWPLLDDRRTDAQREYALYELNLEH